MNDSSRGQAFNPRGGVGYRGGYTPKASAGGAIVSEFSDVPVTNPSFSGDGGPSRGASSSFSGGGGTSFGRGVMSSDAGSTSFGRGNRGFGRGGGSGATTEDFAFAPETNAPASGASAFGRGGTTSNAGPASSSSFGGGGGSSFGRGGSVTANDSSNAPATNPPSSGGSAFGRGGTTSNAAPAPSSSFGRGGRGSSFGRGGGSSDISSAVPAQDPLPSGGGSSFGRGGGASSSFGRGGGAPSSGNAESRPDNFGGDGGNRPANFGASNTDGSHSRGNMHEKDSGQPRPPASNYVPEVRVIDDLFKEDADHAMNYLSIADGDEEVAVSGHNVGHISVIEFWKDAGFEEKLLFNVVERAKYIRPRKIQGQIIPFIMEGQDVKGHAETGSGKTAAFMLPIINAIMKTDRGTTSAFDPPAPYAIIVEPTRELCGQVYEQGRKFAFDTGVSVTKAYGEYNMRENMKELQLSCDILCATPGRLKHLITSNLILLTKFKYFVLDEADHLLEDQFLNEVRDMLQAPGFPPKEKRQTMLFSATFPELVQKLSAEVLREGNVMVSNKKLVSTNSKVKQNILSVSKEDKKAKLLDILKQEQEEATKANVIRRTLVFVRTKRDTDLVSLYLTENRVKATTLHGDRTQGLREKALRDFRNAEAPILVTTDVCARGIDIKDLEHVINFDLPGDAVTYVHRIGRTGRIKQGTSTSFFDEFDSNDCNIAKDLVQFLEDVKQPVPEFLSKVVSGGGGSAPAAVDVKAPIAVEDDGW